MSECRYISGIGQPSRPKGLASPADHWDGARLMAEQSVTSGRGPSEPRRVGRQTSSPMALVDPTQQLLEAAMRGSWQRQTALSNNIANADTPGYRRQEVNFESSCRPR